MELSRKARAVALTITVAASLAISACGSAAEDDKTASPGPTRVGLILKNESNAFFVKMKEGAQRAATAAGVELMTAAGKDSTDSASQVAAIDDMIAAGVRGILITPADAKAIVDSVKKARDKGIVVIALDAPTDPESATDALFATDNVKAGALVGAYAKAAMADRTPKIALLDVGVSTSVSKLRREGFLQGFGIADTDPSIVCQQDTQSGKGKESMEACLQKAPDLNVVYTLNEPRAQGAFEALKAKGIDKDVLLVSIDGGCTGVKAVKDGELGATAQQYPHRMAEKGVEAIAEFARTGAKPGGFTDTGATLVTDRPVAGLDAKDSAYGLANCFG